MNAFTVYLVMQLDSICALFCTLAVISGIAAIATLISFAIFASDDPGSWCSDDNKQLAVRHNEQAPALFKWVKRAGFVCAFALVASALIPSTKTAATMIILPAIANNQTIKHEAGDVYKLAKQALANLATSEKPTQNK